MSHPGGRRGALVEHLRSAFPEYSLSIVGSNHIV